MPVGFVRPEILLSIGAVVTLVDALLAPRRGEAGAVAPRWSIIAVLAPGDAVRRLMCTPTRRRP